MRVCRHGTTWRFRAFLLCSGLVVLPASAQEKSPDGVQMLLPRNAIASIDQPRFVPAREAEIPDEAWILGYVRDGEARACSLNLLNRHEIVNDHVAGQPIAAVW